MELDALGGELVADSVRGREVLGLPGGDPLGDLLLDLGRRDPRHRRPPVADTLEDGLRVLAAQTELGVQGDEAGVRRGHGGLVRLALLPLSAVAELVDRPEELLHGGERLGHVEVVVEHRPQRSRERADVLRHRLTGLHQTLRRDGAEALASGVEVLDAPLGLLEAREAHVVLRLPLDPVEVERRAIVHGHRPEADALRLVLLEEGPGGEEVAEALRHLLLVHLHEAVVHPVVGEDLAGGALALGDLVLVVREHQVETATVEIEGRPEVMRRHHRALDVPAGTAVAPGALPAPLVGGRPLPESEVRGVALALGLGLVEATAGAGLHVVERTVTEPAVALRRANAEVDVPVGRVGVPLVDEGADHLEDALEVIADPGLLVRRQVAQPLHVLREGGGHPVREGAGLLTGLLRPLEDLVVDVGDVPDVVDVHPRGAQVPDQDVVDDETAGVAQVGVVVDRRSADVDLGDVLFLCFEWALLARHRVLKPKHGRESLAPRHR